MSENKIDAFVGAVVIVAAISFGIFAAQSTGLGIGVGQSNYVLTASFRSLEGVGTGTDVRLAGVKIGTVTAVTLNPDPRRHPCRRLHHRLCRRQ